MIRELGYSQLSFSYKEKPMETSVVINIIRVEKHITDGVETLSEAVEEVFDYKLGVCSSVLCERALQRVQELNDMYMTHSRWYITSRVD
ncbi:hypothetical protein [Vibrio phage S4-7]|nr:hypothetical protein [Vibrio phage S4-7]